MDTKLSGHHHKVYQRLLEQPLPHNLQWRDVCSMLGSLSGVETVDGEDGSLKVTRNGETLVVHRPRGKDLADAKELTQVRHFLEKSETLATNTHPGETHLLVVIDHREARIFSAEVHGSIAQKITPYDPFGFGRALHYNQANSDGQRKPELKSYYEAIAKTLAGADQILLFGTGTGARSAMEQLLAELKHRHHALAERVVGSIKVDEHHLTEDQLLAKARGLFRPRSSRSQNGPIEA